MLFASSCRATISAAVIPERTVIKGDYGYSVRPRCNTQKAIMAERTVPEGAVTAAPAVNDAA